MDSSLHRQMLFYFVDYASSYSSFYCFSFSFQFVDFVEIDFAAAAAAVGYVYH